MVAYIPQTPFLSDDTVRRNIALGINDDEIDEKRLQKAIVSAQLEEFISQLPIGKNTIIGDRGIRLSGGQRQRIAIARALYYDRQVLIFDEATSALDSKTENEIVAAIEALHHTKTMIIIAHRTSTLAYCDRVLEIANGSIVEVPETSPQTC
jgi:ABC-type multidrug transport system fused ATPase/permease subunit